MTIGNQALKIRKEWQVLFVCYSPSGRKYYSGKRLEILRALKKAVDEDTSVHDLECLELTERTVNCLDLHGILYLDQLINCPIKRLLEFSQIGPRAIAQMRKAIYLLPELEKRKKQFVAELMPNRDSLDLIRKYGMASVQ